MDFEIYCDESRQELFSSENPRADEYVLIGGLWLEASKREKYKNEIKKLRIEHKLYGEFKWQKVSQSRLDFYLKLIHLFFHSDMRFRVIVLAANELDSVKFHRADNELMFYKFYYQLIHQWILNNNRYRIFVDVKTNRVPNRLTTLKKVLSNANVLSEILQVQALPSHEMNFLQLVDVLIGAVGYRFHKRSASHAKLQVVEKIEKFISHPIQPTSRFEKKFNIFRFQPDGGW